VIGRRTTTLEERDWKHDPWDDADITDALVIERPVASIAPSSTSCTSQRWSRWPD
jgi:hypothetical protein